MADNLFIIIFCLSSECFVTKIKNKALSERVSFLSERALKLDDKPEIKFYSEGFKTSYSFLIPEPMSSSRIFP